MKEISLILEFSDATEQFRIDLKNKTKQDKTKQKKALFLFFKELFESFRYWLVKTNVCEFRRHSSPGKCWEKLYVAMQHPLKDLALDDTVPQVPQISVVAVEAQADTLVFKEEWIRAYVRTGMDPREHPFPVVPPRNSIASFEIPKGVLKK